MNPGFIGSPCRCAIYDMYKSSLLLSVCKYSASFSTLSKSSTRITEWFVGMDHDGQCLGSSTIGTTPAGNVL